MKRLKRAFEYCLWQSRLVALVAVISSVLLALAAFFIATVDTVILLRGLFAYTDPSLGFQDRIKLQTDTITSIVQVVDGYLLATILLIFALGLYELFVSKIDIAERSELASRLLLIRSLDDLKDRLAKVVFLILVVKFFQQALRLKYETTLDLLYLALGILLVGAALYLTSPKDKAK